MIKLHILNTSGSLDSLESTIREEFDKSIKEIQAKIPAENVDVVVYDSLQHVIPEHGFGGHAFTKNIVNVPVDPKFRDIKNSIIEEFKKLLAHELYHTVRNYTYESKNHYLLNSVINEGLADHFSLEVYDSSPNPWSVALSEKDLVKYTKLAEKEFNSDKYNHEEWFFGRGSGKFPRWTGYSLGYYLVGKYFEKNPEKKPSSVIKLKPEDFLV